MRLPQNYTIPYKAKARLRRLSFVEMLDLAVIWFVRVGDIGNATSVPMCLGDGVQVVISQRREGEEKKEENITSKPREIHEVNYFFSVSQITGLLL